MVRDHAEKKAETGEAQDGAPVDGTKTARVIDADANLKEEKRIAFRELEVFRRCKPTLGSAREARVKAMVALNLDIPPRYVFVYGSPTSAYVLWVRSARQTIRYLKDRRQSLLQLTRR